MEDIRKYFRPSSSSKKVDDGKKRKKHVIEDSDSDEEPFPKSYKKPKAMIIDSDDDIFIEKTIKKKPTPKKIPKQKSKQAVKMTAPKDFFSSMTVHRSDRSSDGSEKKKKKLERIDNNFEKTLIELDNEEEVRPKKKLKIESPRKEKYSKHLSPKKAISETNLTGKEGKLDIKRKEAIDINGNRKVDGNKNQKSVEKSKENIRIDKDKLKTTKENGNKTISKTEIIKEKKNKKVVTPKNDKLEAKKFNEKTPEKLDVSIILATPEENPTNTKSLAYRKFLQRAGPRNPGSKAIPEGGPTCLSGLTFVLSGVLESFDREEIGEAIKDRGGRITTCISKVTSYLIIGDEPGESKTKKATHLGIKFLTEDELLELMKSKGKAGKEEPKKDGTPKKRMADIIQEKNEKLKAKDEKSPVIAKILKISKNSPLMSSQSSTTSTLSQSSLPSASSSPRFEKSTADESLWVDKYKPTSLKSIIGQQGDASNAKKLLNWLRNWSKNQSGKVKLVKPSPWAKDNTGAYYKAALLSGPPGVGKTTTVTLVCKDVNFDTVEFNASDTRSKRSMQHEISELLSNKSVAGFRKENRVTSQRVLVMDEVDGMAGNEDRGGMQELIALIKSSKIPIICMCNDRNSQKIRSLANYCFDLRYYKPRVEQIRGAMMSVCYKEGIKIQPDTLDEIIIGSNQDIRQVLNHLSVWSADNKNLLMDQTKKDAKMAKKQFKIGPWDVCTKVFNESAHKGMSIHDKIGLFFYDYSLGPLFVQENYPKVAPTCARGNPKMLLSQLAKTAQSISDGDLVEKAIRSNNAWSLLPTQALFHSVLPGKYMSGHMAAQVEFPRWLGNFSRQKKFDRLSQELHTHMILRISGSKRDVLFDYAQHLRNSVVKPLVSRGQDGVEDAVNVMVSHDLIREDLESLLELSSWPHSKDHMAKVDSKVKAAFTRTINKSSHLNPYGVGNISKKRGKTNSMDSDESDYEENANLSADFLISVAKKTKPKAATKATTSRAKGKGKK